MILARTCTHIIIGLIYLIDLCSTVESFNLSGVIESYNAVCGNRLCNQSILDGFPDLQVYYKGHCPICNCDLACIIYEDCCPDYFFPLNMSCIETNILQFNPYRDDKKAFSMIHSCPAYSDEEMTKLCDFEGNIEEQLQNIPVTSTKTGLTYRNMHCAKCNNEIDKYIIQWTFETDCAQFADFNFLSSYTEIIEYAKKQECNIYYSADKYDKVINYCEDIVDHTVSSCNVSGTWKEYDEDIDFACQTYKNKYKFFKNIFCYICNPPVTSGEIISNCNNSMSWQPLKWNLKQACFQAKATTLTLPFQNIYCYLCNKNNEKVFKGKQLFEEMVVHSKEAMEHERRFIFSYRNGILAYTWILENWQLYFPDKTFGEMSTNNIPKGTDKTLSLYTDGVAQWKDLNFTNLMKQVFAFTGTGTFCQNYSIFTDLEECDCSEHCYFKPLGCCIDKLFEKSTMCTDPKHSSVSGGFLVYNTCPETKNYNLHRLCQETDSHSLFSFIPVEMKIGKEVVHYKNLYCALCSDDYTDNTLLKNESIPIIMWELTVICKVYLPSYYHTSFEEYFKMVRENGCELVYQPQYNIATCEEKHSKLCNITENWITHDADVQYACENINSPFNLYQSTGQSVFCLMCNPENRDEVLYSACNMTGLWKSEGYGHETEEKCLNMPTIHYYAPYKNVFCKQCNVDSTYDIDQKQTMQTFPHRTTDTQIGGILVPSFREIFSFSNVKSDSKRKEETTRCNESQILFHDNVRHSLIYI